MKSKFSFCFNTLQIVSCRLIAFILYLFSQVYFYSDSAKSGIAVEYPDIIIHAISRQQGQPNIYCQLDAGLFFPNQQLPEDEDERAETVTELRLIPRDGGACK